MWKLWTIINNPGWVTYLKFAGLGVRAIRETLRLFTTDIHTNFLTLFQNQPPNCYSISDQTLSGTALICLNIWNGLKSRMFIEFAHFSYDDQNNDYWKTFPLGPILQFVTVEQSGPTKAPHIPTTGVPSPPPTTSGYWNNECRMRDRG